MPCVVPVITATGAAEGMLTLTSQTSLTPPPGPAETGQPAQGQQPARPRRRDHGAEVEHAGQQQQACNREPVAAAIVTRALATQCLDGFARYWQLQLPGLRLFNQLLEQRGREACNLQDIG